VSLINESDRYVLTLVAYGITRTES